MRPKTLLSPTTLGTLSLKNHIVMAPMTRNRAVSDNTPNELMVEYYEQRSGAGLIITEGTSPSPNGVGYPRIPGIWSKGQIEAWKKVTQAVHNKGARIFLQLMHTGRVGHPLNLPQGAFVLAPSAIAVEGDLYTDAQGLQPHPIPRAMMGDEVTMALNEYVQAAINAMEAGFDGVELHGANGYLMEQFISTQTNQRMDAWGGTIEKRSSFVIKTTKAVANAIGGERVGIRLSPYGVNAGMKPYPEIDETYLLCIRLLKETGIQYIHLVDHSSMGAPTVPDSLKLALRKEWPRSFIICGGYDPDTAESALRENRGDLVAFARYFISNPDFVTRIEKGLSFAAPDFATFYTPGPKGYTDYPLAS